MYRYPRTTEIPRRLHPLDGHDSFGGLVVCTFLVNRPPRRIGDWR